MNKVPAKPGGLLFLDLSLHTGWVYGGREHIAAPGPLWGKFNIDEPTLGKRMFALDCELSDLIHRYNPGKVGIEAPLRVVKNRSGHAAELLFCLAGQSEATCVRWEKPFFKSEFDKTRNAVLGRRHMNDLETAAGLTVKSAIVAPWVERMGWDIPDEDARDAAVGWAFEMGIRYRGLK